MTKTTDTDRIAELEAIVLAQTKRIDALEASHEERLDEQSGAIGALAAATMVLQLATRVKDVGKRLEFAEQKKTIESALLKQRWPAEGKRASKMLDAAQQTSGAAFGWIEAMMAPLINAFNTEEAERQIRDERGSMPAGVFETLKAADRTHIARTGTFDDVRRGNALSTPRTNRFGP